MLQELRELLRNRAIAGIQNLHRVPGNRLEDFHRDGGLEILVQKRTRRRCEYVRFDPAIP